MNDIATNCPRCDRSLTTSDRYCPQCGHQSEKHFPWYKRHQGKLKFLAIGFFFVYLPLSIIGGIFGSLGEELERQAQEDRVITGTGDEIIALVNIDGIILESASGGGFLGLTDDVVSARRLKKTLNEIKTDDNVKALLLRVNSPGGTAAAAEEILRELNDFKASTDMPVVVYFTDIATSGAYYVSLAADTIVANPSTITGSVGVIISYLSFRELAQEYGIQQVVYKSGELKDLTNPFGEVTDREQIVLEQLVRDAYQNFRQAVVDGRGLTENQLNVIGDGRIVSAKTALDLNLIDQIGHFEDAISQARELADLPEAKVIEYGRSTFIELILGTISRQLTVGSLTNLNSPINQLFQTQPGIRVWYIYSL